MSTPFADSHKVAILMGTYQGERYILEQLESFKAQSHKNWQLYVSDDGSTDETLSKIERFSTENKIEISILPGPKAGFVSNFLSLLSKVDLGDACYSFSDQDDIWHKDKIERAVSWLASQPSSKPALYCSRTHIVDENGGDLGLSYPFTVAPSFTNALIQNIGGGNTMIFNQAARNVIVNAGIVDVTTHDWWIYILITGVGGVVHYDAEPSLDYRQHAGNAIGFDSVSKRRLSKLSKLLRGESRGWHAANIEALEKNRDCLTSENNQKLHWFRKVHDANLLVRNFYYFKLGLYRQGFFDNLGVFLLVQLKKI